MIINSAMKVTIEAIGNEKNPLIILDDFALEPNALIELAQRPPIFSAQTTDFYPGLRKPLAGDYPAQALTQLEPLIRQVFAVPTENTAQLSLCAFSLSTTPPHKLRPIQCVPHIDTHDPHQFALIHYLCADTFGGTSFYRHRHSGYETISQARLAGYFKKLKEEVTSGGLVHANYINGDTELFERIANLPIKFNRAVIYRSNALHSGNIDPALGLSHHPSKGRLTANSFIHFSAPADSSAITTPHPINK
jgi:hypothetical protein